MQIPTGSCSALSVNSRVLHEHRILLQWGQNGRGIEWYRGRVYRFRKKERIFIEGVVFLSFLCSDQNELCSPFATALFFAFSGVVLRWIICFSLTRA